MNVKALAQIASHLADGVRIRIEREINQHQGLHQVWILSGDSHRDLRSQRVSYQHRRLRSQSLHDLQHVLHVTLQAVYTSRIPPGLPMTAQIRDEHRVLLTKQQCEIVPDITTVTMTM